MQGNEPRIAPLGADEAAAAAEACGVPERMARLCIFQVLLRHPRLARAVNDLLWTMLADGRLPVRLRELAIMRIGWTTGSVYEWTQHWTIAKLLGVPEEDLLATRDWRAHEAFGPAERAVLQAVDDVVEGGTIRPETWRACAAELGDDPAVLIELVGVIGAWRMVSSLLRSLEVPLEPGTAPWPPDGRTPPSA
jgi:alkylhydroperoxidase family enzyme